MFIQNFIEQSFQATVDSFFAVLPQPVPLPERLQACRIISHRGERDNKHIFENTIPALDRVKNAGIWGLEFDVRWTLDLQPVVFHDQDCRRLFGSSVSIHQITLAQLRAEQPLIPTLEEVIVRYGGKLHLMIELKPETYPDPVRQSQILSGLLSDLRPSLDYHILSLRPSMFKLIDFVPRSTFFPVSILNARELSELTLRENYAGISGHYAFLSNEMLARHKAQGQKVGTGFVFSKNCLFRELNRGVDWIFTNHAVKLQRILDSCRQADHR
jgi:glycerophosphoryl diester phosphodiesterase